MALIAPSVTIRRFGESPANDNSAIYDLRMFGIGTVVIRVDLLALPDAPLRRALGQAIIIHATDTATAASLGLSGQVRRPWSPAGFGFSDTAFRIFILMASRRLNSDRFFTTDFTPETYTPAGMAWLEKTSMIDIVLRHYPQLRPALRGVQNGFQPWNRVNTR